MTKVSRIINTHLVQADRPYSIYRFVYDRELTGLAAVVATLLIVKEDDNGNVITESKPVYKWIAGNVIWEDDHARTFEEKNCSDIEYFGKEGETVGIEKLNELKLMDIKDGDGEMGLESMISMIEQAGMNFSKDYQRPENFENIPLYVVKNNYDKNNRQCFLRSAEHLSFNIELTDCYSKWSNPFSLLAWEIHEWQGIIGKDSVITFVSGYNKERPKNTIVTKILENIGLYMKHIEESEREDGESLMDNALHIRCTIGKPTVSVDDLKNFLEESRYSEGENIILGLKEENLLSVDADTIVFSPVVEQLADALVVINETLHKLDNED